MKRRQFLLVFGGSLLGGAAIVGVGFFGREIRESFCITESFDELPFSIKIIITDLPAEDVCALKSIVPLHGGFGMVEVNGYLIPVQDWADFTNL